MKVHLRFPSFWRKVYRDYDAVMNEHVSIELVDADQRQEYLVGHELALGVLMDMQKVWDVQTAVEADEDIPIESLSDILCSDVGCTLYREESIGMKYKLFVQNIEKHLKQLQFHDYDATEMASFRNLMKIEWGKGNWRFSLFCSPRWASALLDIDDHSGCCDCQRRVDVSLACANQVACCFPVRSSPHAMGRAALR